MKIAMLTSAHYFDDIRVFRKQALSLRQAGYDVTVIAPKERAETINSVKIVGVPVVRGRLKRFLVTTWRVLRAGIRVNADVYHFHDPELIPAGLILRLRGKRVLYDVHEDTPRQVMSKPWIPSAVRPLVARCVAVLEWFAGIGMTRIIVATPSIGRHFPSRKTVVVQNFPLQKEFASSARGEPYPSRPNWVVYIGGITSIRGGREMIQAIGCVSKRLDATLHMAGAISPKTFESQLSTTRGWENVCYHGWQTREQVAKLLGRVRVGLVLFHPEPNHVEAQPNKLFEYMSAGIPVIASHFPLWSEILERVGCGLVVNPMDPSAIADAIEYLLVERGVAEKMGLRGRAAVEKIYNWESEARKLLDLYETIRI